MIAWKSTCLDKFATFSGRYCYYASHLCKREVGLILTPSLVCTYTYKCLCSTSLSPWSNVPSRRHSECQHFIFSSELLFAAVRLFLLQYHTRHPQSQALQLVARSLLIPPDLSGMLCSAWQPCSFSGLRESLKAHSSSQFSKKRTSPSLRLAHW